MTDLSRGVKPFSTEPEQLYDGVTRLCVPFEDIFTSVYVLLEGERCAVLDSADKAEDVQRYLFPFLQAKQWTPEYLICSHFHGDHCGGSQTLLAAYPDCKAVGFAPSSPFPAERWIQAEDGRMLFDRFALLRLPGHTDDSLAVYDMKTKVLFTCDCLQQCGVSRYGTGITDANAYVHSVARVRSLNVEALVAAHNFVPGGDIAEGKAAVAAYLNVCIDTLVNTKTFIDAHENGMEMCSDEHYTDKTIAEMYNDTHAYHPPLDAGKIAAIRRLDLTLL